MFRKLGLLAIVALLLSGCSTAPKPWSAGTGPIKIVASTNVWGSVANLVGGKNATVTALVYNSNQDPHSFEASARDQLAINDADIVIMNGGGYDDFVEKLVEADPTPAILVNAYMASGEDDGRNEHIWYDVDQVGDVAAVIGGAIEAVDSKLSDEVWASVDSFRAELAKRKAELDAIASSGACGKVFATEPLVDYLLEDAGCVNVTPQAFSDAIEEERDVPPAVIDDCEKILKAGVDFMAVNISVGSAQVEELQRTSAGKVATYGFGELLEMDPDTGEYYGTYFNLLDDAITTIGGKF